MIKFDVPNRYTGEPQFTAEIDCAEFAPRLRELRLAVVWAIENGADLRETNLSGADLSDAILSGANLRGADLSDAILSGANLRGANLSDAILSDAILSGANLRGTNLIESNLTGADLTGTNLIESNLTGADLRGTDLNESNLTGADLRGTDLSDANLRGANLRGVRLWDAIGNRKHIKSMQIERWSIAYTATHMQIGCENHAISDWWAFDEQRIAKMDADALEWWRKWKPILQQIIEMSPAEPTGAGEQTND